MNLECHPEPLEEGQDKEVVCVGRKIKLQVTCTGKICGERIFSSISLCLCAFISGRLAQKRGTNSNLDMVAKSKIFRCSLKREKSDCALGLNEQS